jgi:hypothetical protein
MSKLTKRVVFIRVGLWGLWAVALLVLAIVQDVDKGFQMWAGWCSGGMMGILFCWSAIDLKEIRRRNR